MWEDVKMRVPALAPSNLGGACNIMKVQVIRLMITNLARWLNHCGFETCLPVWVGVPRRSLWSWLWPRGHRPNHGRQRIEQKELHTQNYLGGNDPVDLDHPNVCPTSHLGGSSSISSEPRFCPCCTTAVREKYSKIDTPKSWWWWFYPHLHHHCKTTTVTQKNVVISSHW